MTELTDTERRVIDFAAQRFKFAGAREAAIRTEFDWTLTRYSQVLNALLERPEALAYDPMTVKRLVRLRDARRAQRSGSSQA